MKTDLINIGLIALSLVLSFIAPFHLFLFAYAVMGPLHYLTEIHWLHRRQYFLPQKRWVVLLALLSVLVFFASFIFPNWAIWGRTFVYLAFMSALIGIITNKPIFQLTLIALAFVLGVYFQQATWYLIFFGVLLTTIVHVFIFTGSFMLYGAMKQRNITGYLAVILLVLAAGVCFFPLISPTLLATDAVKEAYQMFKALNVELFRLFDFPFMDIFTSENGLAVMRFIAFAYTYHYLNWFSKTRVIGWGDIPRRHAIPIVVFWLIIVSLYAYDYRWGFLASLLLSIAHVFLEFPLNHKTFAGIIKSIRIY